MSAGNEMLSSEDTDCTIQDEVESSNGSEFLGQDPAGEIISQLKEKFRSTVRRSEKVKILTALPKSWSVRKIVKEFGASNYMARQAKKLVLEKGFLSSPNPKPGNPLPERTKQLVLDVYLSDDISRMQPGMKNTVSCMNAEGRRVTEQKRLLLCNLKEAYQHFKSLHPDAKVGFSTFASMRPKECVLAGANGTHSVCVCTLHQNTKLMFIGSKLPSLSEQQFLHYRHCLEAIMCDPPTRDCYLSKCTQCPGTGPLEERLHKIMDDNLIDNIQYQQWTHTDRSSLITVVQPVEEFLDSFIDMLQKLKYHDYIAKVQNSFFNQLKTALRPDEYIVVQIFQKTINVLFKMQFNCIIGIQHMLLFIHFYAITKTMANFITLALL